MNAQSNLSGVQSKQTTQQAQEIELMAYVGAIIDRKLFVIAFTLFFMVIGVIKAMFATPIYKVNAIVHVENKKASLPGLDEMSAVFDSKSNSNAEIELLKSRAIIGKTVDDLELDLFAKPKLFPYIGERFYRRYVPSSDSSLAEPKFGASSYAWGGEKIDVFKFSLPESLIGATFILIAGEEGEFQLFRGENLILDGVVGKPATKGSISLTLKELVARPGTEFVIRKRMRSATILSYQNKLTIYEKGRNTGILVLEMNSANPSEAQNFINSLADNYMRQNIARNGAEAQKSLDFLQKQLPIVKQQLEYAESKYNQFKIAEQSVDISIETESILERIVELDTKLQELDLERLEMSQKFKSEHPLYQSVAGKISQIQAQKQDLLSEVGGLPKTQQMLLSLRRDVEVNNEIYMLLLSKTQELDIVRAGTVGNVRVIDYAESSALRPFKPNKIIIVAVFTFLGGFLAVAIVILKKVLHRGVQDPSEIEALGLSVYASVPYSEYQTKLVGFSKARKGARGKAKSILAVDNPADLSIEALRSLRTSLHFAMMEATNNVITISGPSPGVGKSFVSVNLATVLAQGGKKILIIDADMRKGYLQTQFAMKWENGLSDYLSGRLELKDVIKSSSVDNLDVITRGQIPPNPSELLMHSNFSKLIDEVKSQYDIVLVDTPPILAVTDPAIVGAHTGTLLLVTRFEESHIREIELTRNRFEQNGIQVKGVVFNGVQKKASNAYGYYGYYNYEYKSGK
ncbi:polysaccharide biosynthesis tyrosine autokinase [Pseudoalteromonas phenolica]|uniref:polysaccharide biosynthesis tyrosine autokinase n=1 Tax=Pseudoalteromonas phenolica TaxID=161398 RepID=UPI00384C8D6D